MNSSTHTLPSPAAPAGMPAKIRCVVVDDEPLAVRLLEGYIDRHESLFLEGSFTDALKALELIATKPVDLVLLDINMPAVNGLEFARKIPKSSRVIFITAYDRYALESFRVHAVNYLLKPVSYDEFCEAVNSAMEYGIIGVKQSSQPHQPIQTITEFTEISPESSLKITAGADWIVVKSEYRLVKIEYKSIVYITGLKDYIKIVTDDGRKPILTQMPLKQIEEKLIDKGFVRVHRSFIVNISKIKELTRNGITFDGVSIPVGDTYRKSLLQLLQS